MKRLLLGCLLLSLSSTSWAVGLSHTSGYEQPSQVSATPPVARPEAQTRLRVPSRGALSLAEQLRFLFPPRPGR